MARARNLKPALFKNELLGVADPLLTLLFESLWCLADRLGRLEDRPLRIKAETFPYREKLDVNVYLTELERLGFICRYVADGVAVIQVENFLKHQNPHKTERPSELPEKPLKSDSCPLTVRDTLNNGSHPADSLLPLTDSLLLIPYLPKPEKVKRATPSALPDWVPVSQWDGYMEMRKAIKKVPTDRAVELLIASLDKMRAAGQDIGAVLDKSVANNWTDVYPIKPGYATAGQATAKQSRHSGFDAIDYSEGIEDGRIL
tara:strand:+ start:583 stop:1359 length:777 start_codon:yes stop_codon:yes gene_type:complete